MKNNLNDILFLMDEFTFSHNSELGEQDSEPAPSSGGGGGGLSSGGNGGSGIVVIRYKFQ